MIQEKIRPIETISVKKPLLRGWFHSMAAVGAVVLTVALCWMSRGDIPRMISMVIFSLSMIELYTMSAI
jgi:hemolysin III